MKLKWTQGNGCKLFAVLLTGLVTVAAAAAPAKAPDPPKKPPRVRTGYIAKAEFTTEKPSSEGESRIGGKSSPAWAIITLDLDPGRAVSVFDYVLTKDGTEYPCLDMAENDDAFTGMLRNYSSMNPRKCRLAFAVPSADDEYGIVFKLADDSNPVKLNVKPPQESDPAHETQNVSQSRTSQESKPASQNVSQSQTTADVNKTSSKSSSKEQRIKGLKEYLKILKQLERLNQ